MISLEDVVKIGSALSGFFVLVYGLIRSLIILYFKTAQKRDDEKDLALKTSIHTLEDLICEIQERIGQIQNNLSFQVNDLNKNFTEKIHTLEKLHTAYLGELSLIHERVKENGKDYTSIVEALKEFVISAQTRFEKVESELVQIGKELFMVKGRSKRDDK
ncbi:MAG: hypothetical protein SGI74_10400 [Oligoflexia bacterium]|nr:hypothetical protein [Oligoflexia bacterium]